MNKLLFIIFILIIAGNAQAKTNPKVSSLENEFSLFIRDFMSCRAEAREFLNKHNPNASQSVLTDRIAQCLKGSASSHSASAGVWKECARRFSALETLKRSYTREPITFEYMQSYYAGCRQNYNELIVEDLTIAL